MSHNFPHGNMFPDDPMSPLYEEELEPEEELSFEDED
jgi:hypothetical protein